MAKNRNPNPETRNWGNRRDAEAWSQMFSHRSADETRIFTIKSPPHEPRNLMWPPPHEPSPHPDPLPSHPMGAEREQQADTNCLIKARRPESGSGVRCANFFRGNHPIPLPRGGEGAVATGEDAVHGKEISSNARAQTWNLSSPHKPSAGYFEPLRHSFAEK